MLRLIVVPCLNAHKRHVRDPPPSPITLLPRLLAGPREKPVDVVSREAGDTCLPQPGRFIGLVDRPGYNLDTLVFRPLYDRRVIQCDFMAQIDDGSRIGHGA